MIASRVAYKMIAKMLFFIRDNEPNGEEFVKELENILEPFFLKYNYCPPSHMLHSLDNYRGASPF